MRGVKILALAACVIVFGGPYAWLMGSAFKTRSDLFATVFPLSWRTFIPAQPTLENFRVLLFERNFGQAMFNSAVLAVTVVATTLLIASMIAFALAYLQFPGRTLVFSLILATMLIPFEARLVPTFLIVNNLHLQDTFVGLFLPLTVDAFTIFLLRQHFMNTPSELFEAALADGCSYFRVYWNIMLPNITPALASAAFIKFMFAWDAFAWPLIAVRDPSKEVVSIAIARLFSDQEVLWQLVFAGSLLATLPAVILFLLLQRYYIDSALTSGMGGQ